VCVKKCIKVSSTVTRLSARSSYSWGVGTGKSSMLCLHCSPLQTAGQFCGSVILLVDVSVGRRRVCSIKVNHLWNDENGVEYDIL
jgi:hypothetical protein